MRRSISLTVAVLVGGLLMSSCGGDSGSEGAGLHVTSEVVSHKSTKDMLVFAPDAEGRWPVIVAFHGIGGTGQDMAEIATRLAREGSVVFAPTYGTDITTQEGIDRAAVDAECGYRFARSIAAEYGGDLGQPVTFVGWSLGASAALAIGLTEEVDPTGEFVSCFGQVPRPDIIVAISGCHYEGGQLDFVDTEAWGTRRPISSSSPARRTPTALRGRPGTPLARCGWVRRQSPDARRGGPFRPGLPRPSGRPVRGGERSCGGAVRRGDPGCHRRQAAPDLIGPFAPGASAELSSAGNHPEVRPPKVALRDLDTQRFHDALDRPTVPPRAACLFTSVLRRESPSRRGG